MSNAYFQALIQTGIIGAILFVGAFVWAWKRAFQFLVNRPVFMKGTDRLFLVEALAVLVFFTFRSFFESTAAFYGVDLIFLAPAMVYLQRLSSEKTLKTLISTAELKLG